MEDEIPLLKEPSSDSDLEELQEVSLAPSESPTVLFSDSENAAGFVPSVRETVSFKTETNQDAGPSILQSTSSAVKGKNEDSTMSESTSPSTEPNQDVSSSHSSTTETNQDAGPATSSVVLSNRNVGPSVSSAILPNQIIGPSTSSAFLSIQNDGQSLSSSTEINGSNELILSGQYVRRNIHHEGASTFDEEQPTENDPLLPPAPPYYHDIIPIFESGSHIPSPPPAVLKSLFCCFFGEYYLYYARRIRNSRFMLILLVALLALPLSALIMGFKYYFSSCSGSSRTPLLLCVAGGLGLFLNGLRILTITSRRFENLGVCEPPRFLVETSALLIFSLFIVEIIEFFGNKAVFDDPSHPLYCPESLHEYIFYVNFVVLAIGICALLIHLPTTPMNDLQRYVVEAAEAATSRQQNENPVADDPNQPPVYTPWVKPRRRSRPRPRLYGMAFLAQIEREARRQERSYNASIAHFGEVGIEISYTTSEETAVVGETVGDGDMEDNYFDPSRPMYSSDEEYTAQRPMRDRMGDQSVESSQRFLQEGSIDVTVDDRRGHEEGAVGRSIEGGAVSRDIEDFAVGGNIEDFAVGGDLKYTRWGPIIGRMWNQSAVGSRIIGGDAVGGDIEDRTETRENRALRWEEGESLDTRPRNRSSTYTIHRGEENPVCDLSGPSRWDEEDGLRSRRLEARSNYGTRLETGEVGTRPKRNERITDPLQTEMTETEVSNEGRVESEGLGTNWHEYGARPKTKVNVECTPKITVDSERRNESSVATNIILRNKEVSEIDASGNQGNVGDEGGALSKVIKDVERGGNTDDKQKEGAGADTGDEVKEHSEVEEVTEGGDLPKCEESIESDIMPQISECTESADSEKSKETEDDDALNG